MEDALLDLMYEIPSDKSIEQVIVTKDAIEKKQPPTIVRGVKPSEEEIIQAFESAGEKISC